MKIISCSPSANLGIHAHTRTHTHETEVHTHTVQSGCCCQLFLALAAQTASIWYRSDIDDRSVCGWKMDAVTHSVAPVPLIVFPSGIGLSWIGSGFLLFCMFHTEDTHTLQQQSGRMSRGAPTHTHTHTDTHRHTRTHTHTHTGRSGLWGRKWAALRIHTPSSY